MASFGAGASTSRLWREVQQPLGVADVASAVFRDGYGWWGFLDLWPPAPLEGDQLRLLESVLPEVITALRAAQADTLRAVPSGPPEHPGPAILLMDPDLGIVGSTPGMDSGLPRLLPRPDGLPPVSTAALNAARSAARGRDWRR